MMIMRAIWPITRCGTTNGIFRANYTTLEKAIFPPPMLTHWEGYDDFSGSELNSQQSGMLPGGMVGTAPSIDQLNNRVEFTKGSSYEANLI